VRKLEEKNPELELVRAQLEASNVELERRVRERTQDLENEKKDLDSFAHSVSHDLQAPVRAIRGFSQILLSESASRLSEQDRHLLGRVCDSATRLALMIDSLLNLCRLGRQHLAKRVVKVNDLVHAVLEEQRDQLKDRKVEVNIGELPDCTADPTLFKQVWVNLLSNALKYSARKEHAVIGITSERRARETIYRVPDNGAGFDMQYASRLFEAFQRLHSAREFEGTGVGLSIVKRIVQRHGGRIWAEGVMGEGASFYFTIEPPPPALLPA